MKKLTKSMIVKKIITIYEKNKLNIKTKTKNYPIYIGYNILKILIKFLKKIIKLINV